MANVTYKFYGQNTVDDRIDVGAPVPKVNQLIFTEGVKLVNADPDNDGGCALRPGYIQRYSGDVAAMFANDGMLIFQEGATLKSLDIDDYSAKYLSLGLDPDGTMACCDIDGMIVYSDGRTMGKIYNGVRRAFATPTVQFKIATPPGQCLAKFKQHLLVGVADGFVMTDPETVDEMDERQCRFPMGAPAIMIVEVDNGLYVSTDKRIYFVAGRGLPEWLQPDAVKEIAKYPAFPGTGIKIKADKTGLQNVEGNIAVFTTPMGICYGLNDGTLLNVTQDKDRPGDTYTAGTAILRESAAGQSGGGLFHYLTLFNDGTNFTGRVMNTKHNGTAEYQGYNFRSVVCYRGRYFGCNADGIFEFTGTDDDGAPINAEWLSGVSNAGSEMQKYFPDAYLTLRCEGKMEFSLAVDEGIAETYTVDFDEGRVGIHKKRCPLAKGVRGGQVQIGWKNVAGSYFNIQQAELEVAPSASRRVR